MCETRLSISHPEFDGKMQANDPRRNILVHSGGRLERLFKPYDARNPQAAVSPNDINRMSIGSIEFGIDTEGEFTLSDGRKLQMFYLPDSPLPSLTNNPKADIRRVSSYDVLNVLKYTAYGLGVSYELALLAQSAFSLSTKGKLPKLTDGDLQFLQNNSCLEALLSLNHHGAAVAQTVPPSKNPPIVGNPDAKLAPVWFGDLAGESDGCGRGRFMTACRS